MSLINSLMDDHRVINHGVGVSQIEIKNHDLIITFKNGCEIQIIKINQKYAVVRTSVVDFNGRLHSHLYDGDEAFIHYLLDKIPLYNEKTDNNKIFKYYNYKLDENERL